MSALFRSVACLGILVLVVVAAGCADEGETRDDAAVVPADGGDGRTLPAPEVQPGDALDSPTLPAGPDAPVAPADVPLVAVDAVVEAAAPADVAPGKPDLPDPPRGTFDGGGIEVRQPSAPPVIAPGAIKLLPRGAMLVGGIATGCTHGPASVASGARWCAVARVGSTLGRYELWVMNLAKLPPRCDGTDASSCFKLSDNLFSSTPQTGPKFPTAHRFYGDTLIYHADAVSSPSDPFSGPIYAWQPGWSTPKQISRTNTAYQCVGVAKAPVALCLENLVLDDPINFDLTAGNIAGGQPVKQIAKVFPSHPDTMASQWSASFTPDGKYLVYSAPQPPSSPGGLQTPETLYYLESDKIGIEAPKQVGAPGISQWEIAPDQSKWFYLTDYNYSTTAPSGTLYMADFPSGANPTKLSSTLIGSGNLAGVADFILAPTRDTPAKVAFIGLLQKLTADGRGTYTIIKNPAGALDDATNVVHMLTDAPGLPSNSPDLRFGRYFQTLSMTLMGLTDSRILNYGSLARCTLAMNPTSTLFGAAFLDNAALTFWADNYDRDTDSAEGWVASPEDCSSKKRKFATGIDYWFVRGDDQLVYTDGVQGEVSTLRVAKITAGDLGLGEIIQAGIARTSWGLLLNQEAVLYQIQSSSEAADGIYYHALK